MWPHLLWVNQVYYAICELSQWVTSGLCNCLILSFSFNLNTVYHWVKNKSLCHLTVATNTSRKKEKNILQLIFPVSHLYFPNIPCYCHMIYAGELTSDDSFWENKEAKSEFSGFFLILLNSPIVDLNKQALLFLHVFAAPTPWMQIFWNQNKKFL